MHVALALARVATDAAAITGCVPPLDWYPICYCYVSVALEPYWWWLSEWVVLWRSLVNPFGHRRLGSSVGTQVIMWTMWCHHHANKRTISTVGEKYGRFLKPCRLLALVVVALV